MKESELCNAGSLCACPGISPELLFCFVVTPFMEHVETDLAQDLKFATETQKHAEAVSSQAD